MVSSRSNRIQAAKELNLKLNLELKIEKDFNSLFNKIIKEFVARTAQGKILTASEFDDDVLLLLDKSIILVQNNFSGVVSSSNYLTNKKAAEIAITRPLIDWKEIRKAFSSRKITATTQKNIDDSLDIARELLIEQGEELTKRNIASTAASILRKFTDVRKKTVAIVETQAASEATKYIEAQEASGITPVIDYIGGRENISKTQKQWVTMGDDRVRHPPESKFDHVSADGQTVPLVEPYIVSGEKMMHPADSSMGASAGNIYGCRCSSIYIID